MVRLLFFDKFIPKNIQNYFVGGKRNNRMIARMHVNVALTLFAD